MSDWVRRRRSILAASGLILATTACGVGPEQAREVGHGGAHREAHAMSAVVAKPDPNERKRFNGKFVLCHPEARKVAGEELREALRKDVDGFVDANYASKSKKEKRKARARLAAYTTSPYLPDRFELVVDSADKIIMNVERGAWTVTAPSNGSWVNHPDWEGTAMRISFGIYADERDDIPKMVQQFRKFKGTRLNVSYIDETGDLHLTVSLESRFLPEPFIYRVTYCRE